MDFFDLRPRLVVALLVLASACASSRTTEAPPAPGGSVAGWFLSGPAMSGFRVDVDRDVHFSGKGSGRLASLVGSNGDGAATLMQSLSSDPWLGKRVRLTAMIKTRSVSGWSGLWMRVERPDGRVTFDNMQARPIRGTTDWTRAEVVLDVARDANAIQLGLLQDGHGTSWIDDVSLAAVGNEVPTTNADPLPRAIANSDFERGLETLSKSPASPVSWAIEGFAREDFAASVDLAEKHSGRASAKLFGDVPEPRGPAELVQTIRAEEHAGTRIRVSAWVKGRSVERGGAFATTVHAADAGPMSPGLTSAACALAGTFDWRRCEVVLDVPPFADTLRTALELEGPGTAWMDDVLVETVGLDVPVTTIDRRARKLENGDLEQGETLPSSWLLSGEARAHYQASIDRDVKHGGKQSARLEPRVKDPGGYGTMMQTFRADDLRGKRLRLDAFVKGEGIDGHGDLWTRVQAADSPEDGGGLGGGACTLAGTFDWTRCSIVFDIPARGDAIDVGIGLGAHGRIWLDDVTVEEVPSSVPLTRRRASYHLIDGSFESAKEKPDGWSLAGAGRNDFAVVIDRTEHSDGQTSVRFEAKVSRPRGYGTLTTTLLAEDYRGKRMRMTAKVRGRDVIDHGDTWLRVRSLISPADGPGLGGGACGLTGTFEWKPCEVVFDVPRTAMWIEAGVGLTGAGTVWLDDVRLEEVEPNTKVTGLVREKVDPENLDFEQ